MGITGVPGVGKSTFVDAMGMLLLGLGHRVAVLAIDPSSTLSGGSILGDKTRMARLSLEPGAFIRPSPSGATPGGIARRTRETMLLCEAAGFDVVFVETVGVGQGETAVADMVDFFLVLALPGSGDELQGIKKGVLELADAIAVNKADGDGAARARAALGDIKAALRYLPRKRASWLPRALAISGLTGAGLEELWGIVEEHRAALELDGRARRPPLRAAARVDVVAHRRSPRAKLPRASAGGGPSPRRRGRRHRGTDDADSGRGVSSGRARPRRAGVTLGAPVRDGCAPLANGAGRPNIGSQAVMEIDLREAAEELRRRFGKQVDAPYVPGKTLFRDTLCERFGISQAEGEVLCDSLEQCRSVRFERSGVLGNGWTIEPERATSAEA